MKRRFRHKAVKIVLRPFFHLYIYVKYNVKITPFRQKELKGPFLVLGNHTLLTDAFVMGMSFKDPLYYVASDMIFSVPYLGKIMSFLASPIPKTKYRSDTETIKDIIRMVKSGGSIAIYPEGNATFHGGLMPMPKSIGKLVKLLKIPVLLYRVEGGYLTKPRWANTVRKGRMKGYVHDILTPDQVKNMTADAINDLIVKGLDVNDNQSQETNPIAFKGGKLAENIETAFYICPKCHKLATLRSEDADVRCQSCEFHVRYTVYGTFENIGNTHFYKTSTPWYDFQLNVVKDIVKDAKQKPNEPICKDDIPRMLEVTRATKKDPRGKATLTLFSEYINIESAAGIHEQWPLQDVLCSVQQKNKLILHHVTRDVTYYFLGPKKRSGLKYVHLIEALKEEEN